MNNKLIPIMLASTLMLLSEVGIADSEGKSYFGVQYAIGNYSEKNISEDFKPTALVGRFGYFFHPSYSIEGRIGTGLQEDTQFLPEFGVGGLDATFDLDSIMGVYGRGHINLTKSSSLYGVLGVTKVEATVSVPGLPAAELTSDESGVSYGIGADIAVSKSFLLNIEYMRYLDKDNLDLGVAGAGVTINF